MDKIIKKTNPKKWAILLGYCGRDYYGMQWQLYKQQMRHEVPTIESELFNAFRKAGLCNEMEYNNPKLLMHFQRAARTDKSVSAVRQIISMQTEANAAELLPEVNRHLPPVIRLFQAKEVTKNFDSKIFCDARTYSYLLPSFALCPVDQVTNEQYRVSAQVVEQFNSILQMYIGPHHFHNFTAGKKPTDASSRRYIISFECSGPFRMGYEGRELEFLVARVKGQSFMLHQIRKMIGMAIMVMRGFATPFDIALAFEAERVYLPMAPGLGLLLENVHYDYYNRKHGGNGRRESLHWDLVNRQILAFKSEHIYPTIVRTEITTRSMLKWLANLPIHNLYSYENATQRPPLISAFFNVNPEILRKKAMLESDSNELNEEESSSDEEELDQRNL